MFPLEPVAADPVMICRLPLVLPSPLSMPTEPVGPPVEKPERTSTLPLGPPPAAPLNTCTLPLVPMGEPPVEKTAFPLERPEPLAAPVFITNWPPDTPLPVVIETVPPEEEIESPLDA